MKPKILLLPYKTPQPNLLGEKRVYFILHLVVSHPGVRIGAFCSQYSLEPWFTGYAPATPAMTVSWEKVQGPSSCLVHEAGCLSCSAVYIRVLKKQALMLVKKCLRCKIGECAGENEGRQAECENSPLLCSLGCREKV